MKTKPTFDVEAALLKLPLFCFNWCEYKGKTYHAMINWEATVKAKRPMLDLSACLTYNKPLITVAYHKKKIKDSPLNY